jgi:2-dehydropantoate 2-reductase
MHFLLVGPGALGCLLGSVVAKGLGTTGDRLTILDYNRGRSEYLTREGIVYHFGGTSETIPVTAGSDPHSLTGVDVVLLCVKSYDVEASLDFCRPLLDENTLLLFLQNGIGHLEFDSRLGRAAAAFGTTTEGATLLRQGHVRHAGRGVTYLGFPDKPTKHFGLLLEKTQAVLAAGGLLVEVSEHIIARIWAKLFINVGINALTATLGCKNGELLTRAGVDRRMRNAIDEAMQVARAEGIAILDDPHLATRTVCSKTAENISSMLQDVKNRRPTEIDAINGAVADLGRRNGVATPENSLLCRQVKDIEAGYAGQIPSAGRP